MAPKNLLVFVELVLFAIFPNVFTSNEFKDPHFFDDRTTIVHLFEWKFADIAEECERFLGPMGYGGVQVSPINENLVMEGRPWFERYQPISYKIITRSGDIVDFTDMVARCNKAGVKIYVDTVFNHMTGDQTPAIGTGGSMADTNNLNYTGVPFGSEDFHAKCTISNYMNATEVRDCELSGLHDLDQSKEHVRNEIVKFLNRVVDAGVAGFRVDAAKHMWPSDLKAIYSRIKDLSIAIGNYSTGSRPYIFQEVIDLGFGEGVHKQDYKDLAAVIDFTYGIVVGQAFRSLESLSGLKDLPDRGLLSSKDSLVMVDNHDNQRGHGAGGTTILTYKDGQMYKMAVAFMLAYPFGVSRVMSSFNFSDPSQGPPADDNGTIISPQPYDDASESCGNGWVCEHRWPEVSGMVGFRNVVGNASMENWWTNGKNQIAFSRGDAGFIAFNNEEKSNLLKRLQTGLPQGVYCDVISGRKVNRRCSGQRVLVGRRGMALIRIRGPGVVAIHKNSKL